jgi:WD repeat-containing protein 24
MSSSTNIDAASSSSSSRHRGAARRAAEPRRNHQPVVVAALEPSSSSSSSSLPYSALSFSPCRQYAALACKDLLQIVQVGPQGVSVVLAVRTAPYFQPQPDAATTTSTASRNSSSSMTTSSILSGNSSHRREQPDTGRLNLRDFALGQSSSHHAPVTRDTSNVNVVITDVAWSIGKSASTPRRRRESDDETPRVVGANEGEGDVDDCDYEDDVDLDSAWTMNDAGTTATRKTAEEELQSSFIAAAGSNGMIVVWSAGSLLGLSAPIVGVGDTATATGRRAASSSPSKSSVLVPPEAELSLHTRQVNRLAWHPTHYGWLLSASQDGTVLLWERTKRAPSRSATTTPTTEQPASSAWASSNDASQKTTTMRFRGLFGGFATAASVQQQQQQQQQRSSTFRPIAGQPQKPPPNFQWHCRSTFLPKSEAVRDIRWSPFYDDGTFSGPALSLSNRSRFLA